MIAIVETASTPLLAIFFPHPVASSAQKNKPLMKQSRAISQVHTLFSYAHVRMCPTAEKTF